MSEAFRSSVYMTFRLAPFFPLGKTSLLVVTSLPLYITSWSVQLASLTCIPMSVQKPSVLLFQALSLFHYIFHMQSHPQARLGCILYSFNPKLSCEFQANITNNPEAAST